METPAKSIIKDALAHRSGMVVDDLKKITGLGQTLLYASLMQLEDTGDVIAQKAGNTASFRYSLADGRQ